MREEPGWLRKSLHIFEISESTNNIAMKLASEGCVHGTVVISKNQINGRGRQGRKWQAWPGTLAMSIVLRPHLPLLQSYKLVLASALGTIDALSLLKVPAQIKWPNDIIIDSLDGAWISKLGAFRKAGGILLELNSIHERIDAAVLGIGINLQRPIPDLNVELLEQMGFLSDHHPELAFSSLTNTLLDSLETSLCEASLSDSSSDLLKRVKMKSVLIGKRVQVNQGESSFDGVAEDLSADGALLVRNDCNLVHAVHWGDVSLLKDS